MRPADPLARDGGYRVCFVCTGNICRSPTAEMVFEQLLVEEGLSERVGVLSAGTGSWHLGEDMDPRARRSLEAAGRAAPPHRARRFEADWFDGVDLVVALDRGHRRALEALARSDDDRRKIELLLAFDPDQAGQQDVPDPYYSDQAAYDRVLVSVERACRALLRRVRERVERAESSERS